MRRSVSSSNQSDSAHSRLRKALKQWPPCACRRRQASRLPRHQRSGCEASKGPRAAMRACPRNFSLGAAGKSTRLTRTSAGRSPWRSGAEPAPLRRAHGGCPGRPPDGGGPAARRLPWLAGSGVGRRADSGRVAAGEAALADDSLEEALAELEKVEERPLAKKADTQPKAAPARQAGKAKAAAKKKPSAAPGASTHQCAGRGGDRPCLYSLQRPGQRGNYRGNARQCLFCSAEAMRKAASTAAGRSNVLGGLKKFRAVYEKRAPGRQRGGRSKRAQAQRLLGPRRWLLGSALGGR